MMVVVGGGAVMVVVDEVVVVGWGSETPTAALYYLQPWDAYLRKPYFRRGSRGFVIKRGTNLRKFSKMTAAMLFVENHLSKMINFGEHHKSYFPRLRVNVFRAKVVFVVSMPML